MISHTGNEQPTSKITEAAGNPCCFPIPIRQSAHLTVFGKDLRQYSQNWLKSRPDMFWQAVKTKTLHIFLAKPPDSVEIKTKTKKIQAILSFGTDHSFIL